MDKTTFIVGLDGSDAGERALDFAKDRAKAVGEATIVTCYVIEWSPFAFQTAEENAQRFKRREEEIAMAHERVLDPAITKAQSEGFDVTGVVRHGSAATILHALARQQKATQIIIGRASNSGLKARLFGGVAAKLATTSTIPVTIIP